MVTKVVIKDNSKTPYHYLSGLDNFDNGKEYAFKPGVNIIVGENGSGKSTLMNLIKSYLMVDYTDCDKGVYNCNINHIHKGFGKDSFLDGVEVFADYTRNTFRLSHAGEKVRNQAIESFEDFGTAYQQKNSSTGEGASIALNYLFDYMFGRKAKLKFDYSQFKDNYPKYYEYTQNHKVSGDEWTILMDEPDRNLSICYIEQIKAVLEYHKPLTQIIAVIHNPLLIYSLSYTYANFIEMSEGYVEKVRKTVNEIVGNRK